ncbi:hypothetical protein KDK95_29370 [Actinospica sp. MGRD01-02]|uniref:Uncharacterized protein n=1 Tax=Actinospica acidithermotolerans TaxID=2828514 RepID=A0A941EFG9_9ACTN|nr:hypothetical protein [Actinospica acidithermotolerans]MBR7830447.1 hypothetical protein [Actinospica acidithermotolerans]
MSDHTTEHPYRPLPAGECWTLYCALEAARCADHELAIDFVRDVLENADLDDGVALGPFHRDFLNRLITHRYEGPVDADRLIAALACLAAVNGAVAATRIRAMQVPDSPGSASEMTLSAACPWCGGPREHGRESATWDKAPVPILYCFACGRADALRTVRVEAGHLPWDGEAYAAARARTGTGNGPASSTLGGWPAGGRG